MSRRIIVVLLVFTFCAAGSRADFWDPLFSTLVMSPAADGASVLVTPGGTGKPFDQAYDQFGNYVDATLTLTLIDLNGDPIDNYPAQDIWLETTAGGLQACIAGAVPDFNTDANGQTVWREPLWASGCSVGERVNAVVAGISLYGPGLDLVFRSPDFDGSLVVDLTDIVIFAQALADYGDGCADLNNDGVINLIDICLMTQGIGESCN